MVRVGENPTPLVEAATEPEREVVLAAERGDEVLRPGGETSSEPGDLATVAAERNLAEEVPDRFAPAPVVP